MIDPTGHGSRRRQFRASNHNSNQSIQRKVQEPGNMNNNNESGGKIGSVQYEVDQFGNKYPTNNNNMNNHSQSHSNNNPVDNNSANMAPYQGF